MISVIIATYNSEEYLERALTSVLNQTFNEWECVIVDGASSDSTLNIIENFVAQDNRFRYVSEPDNGIFDAYNKGAKMAKGDWLYYLGSDDELLLNGLEVLYSNSNNSDIVIGDIYSRRTNSVTYAPSKSYKLLVFRMHFCHQGMIMKRSVLNDLSGFDVKYKLTADFDACQKAYFKGYKFKQIQVPICYFNATGASASSFRRTDKEVLQICKKNSLKICYYLLYFYFKIKLLYKTLRGL